MHFFNNLSPSYMISSDILIICGAVNVWISNKVDYAGTMGEIPEKVVLAIESNGHGISLANCFLQMNMCVNIYSARHVIRVPQQTAKSLAKTPDLYHCMYSYVALIVGIVDSFLEPYAQHLLKFGCRSRVVMCLS